MPYGSNLRNWGAGFGQASAEPKAFPNIKAALGIQINFGDAAIRQARWEWWRQGRQKYLAANQLDDAVEAQRP